jgi:hypothetical protein
MPALSALKADRKLVTFVTSNSEFSKEEIINNNMCMHEHTYVHPPASLFK